MATFAIPSKALSLGSITDDYFLNDFDSFAIFPLGVVSVEATFGPIEIPRYKTFPENYDRAIW
eukprot:CAMPEP_0194321096 /NCGR_PEP_ID=MMETSP0171-20130528/17340_1 /TAXON_ID=218684 /ORGANISM="Corethron pennatum, Strain L29A3" /LENGTH=62 /DNA_ID=CAMNT_0039078857 /DNA_START=211 /DNA_END=396 /DNA_ORIENTATION=-